MLLGLFYLSISSNAFLLKMLIQRSRRKSTWCHSWRSASDWRKMRIRFRVTITHCVSCNISDLNIKRTLLHQYVASLSTQIETEPCWKAQTNQCLKFLHNEKIIYVLKGNVNLCTVWLMGIFSSSFFTLPMPCHDLNPMQTLVWKSIV